MQNEKKGLNISTKSFIAAIAVIFALMLLTYLLTFLIPGGEYARITDANGNSVIDTAAGFRSLEGGIPFYKWILSPFLVLAAPGNITLIAVLAFLVIIGGAFNGLEKCGLMNYLLSRIISRFEDRKYRLLAIISLFFMAMGSLIGSFEECVPMVPIVVALCVGLGWDPLTGLGASLLSIGCGFAAGVCNPFTIGVAQSLAGLPMFSGIWLRVLSFVLIYALLTLFLRAHAKKVEGPVDRAVSSFERDPKMDKGLLCFVLILGIGILLVLSSAFLTFLQDYTLIIVCLVFLAAGIAAPLLSGYSGKLLGKNFWDGVVSILPAILMILMASSIKYCLEEAHILDSILHYAVGISESLPKWAMILFLYLLVLVMNFFIASGSAKAFLLIPLIIPIGQIFAIPAQLCVLAFAFGDGFSNVFYPTNPVLLISLGLTGVSYGKWAKWTWKFQFLNLILTAAILLFGLAVGYC